MTFRTVLGALAALAMTCSAVGQASFGIGGGSSSSGKSGGSGKLEVGDPAPGLDIEKWVKNSATTIESGNVYVVEFWATWCGPCKRAIPHLTSLQKKYEDEGLTIIGISDEKFDEVQKFVKQQGDKMKYTVAVDRSQGTNRAWRIAAGINGIPAAFIVDRQSKIAYIGNPHDENFEPTLKKVMSGRFDPKLEAMAAPVIEQARQQRKVNNWRMATLHYDQVIELDPKVFANIAFEKFDMILRDMDRKDEAYAYARDELINGHYANDGLALQIFAERIMLDPKIDPAKRDADVALEAAEVAQRLLGEEDPNAMAVVAMVRFHRGEFKEAIELQQQAWFNAQPKRKPEFERTLRTYQSAASRASNAKPTPSAPSTAGR